MLVRGVDCHMCVAGLRKLRAVSAQAREAYERGLEIEPDDRGLQEAAHAAHVAERKAIEAHAHKFSKRREAPDRAARGRPEAAKKPRAQAAAGVRNQAMLSFVGEDDGEQDDL